MEICFPEIHEKHVVEFSCKSSMHKYQVAQMALSMSLIALLRQLYEPPVFLFLLPAKYMIACHIKHYKYV